LFELWGILPDKIAFILNPSSGLFRMPLYDVDTREKRSIPKLMIVTSGNFPEMLSRKYVKELSDIPLRTTRYSFMGLVKFHSKKVQNLSTYLI
jgi:hypothetical protein